MRFFDAHNFLFSLILAGGITLSLGNDEYIYVNDKNVENKNFFVGANLRLKVQMKIGPDATVIVEKPYKNFLFGKISSTVDLVKLSFLHHDFKFCNIHFNDLDNFLGSLEHNGIRLQQCFAVMCPCVNLELNKQSKLDKHFLSSNYVLQTPNMLITNIGMNQTMRMPNMIFELVEPLTRWLLYGRNIGSIKIKRLEIRGGKMEIVALLMKNLIMLHHNNKKMEKANNFVLLLNGFALESIGIVEFKNGNTLSLKRISDSIWELHHHHQGVMTDDEYEVMEKLRMKQKRMVDAIFEIEKFDF